MMFKIASIAAIFAASVSAHMDMISPCPRYSPRGKNCPAVPAGESLDYSMSSPIGYNEPLCKHTTPFATPSATWSAGQSVTVSFAPGGAPHGGGHCEFSLSYDGGKTFVVVHQQLETCFFKGGADVRDYTFSLPQDLPGSDKAVFAWSWVNAVGNREFYMNCADVAIKGSSGSYTGKEMTVANHQGYPTIPEFSGNSKTGLEIYNAAKKITVNGSGGTTGPAPGTTSAAPATTPIGHTPSASATAAPTSSAPAASSTAAPKPTSTAAPKPTSTAAPKPTSTAAPKPTSTAAPKPTTTNAPAPTEPAGGACTDGQYKCASDGKGYLVCISGAWSNTLQCGSGTVCVQNGASIYCGWSQ